MNEQTPAASPEKESNEEPTLVVTAGMTGNNIRRLTKTATVIGRARGCDLGLNASDVSNLHCLITRTSGGLVVRDCGSRSGTLVNGRAVRESALCHGDTLQIGPFHFRVELPSKWQPTDEFQAQQQEINRLTARVCRMETARRRAIGVSLRRRKRLQEVMGQLTSAQQSVENDDSSMLSSLDGDSDADRLEAVSPEFAAIQQENDKLKRQFETHMTQSKDRLESMRQELETERNRFKQLVREAAGQNRAVAEEIQTLQDAVAERDRTIGELSKASPQELESLKNEVAEHQERIGLLEAELEEARAEKELPDDLAQYEEQLNQFRDQLQQAQEHLEGEKQKLKDKLRTTEMELSTERATLAREKSQIERMKSEFLIELRNVERDAKVRGHLEPLSKLQSELRNKADGGATDEAADPNTFAGKIRGFLKRMGDE